MLVSGCSEGYICLWAVRGSGLDYTYRLLIKIQNNLTEKELCFLRMPIASAKLRVLWKDKEQKAHPSEEPEDVAVILGDELGYLHQWSLKEVILNHFKEGQFKKLPDASRTKMSFNPRKNTFLNV
jgi:hypothetical protein